MPSLPTLTILVIEDDLALRRLITRSLAHEGIASHAAASGAEALQWLAANTADLMLVDLMLPDMSGQELLRQVEATGQNVPFVIITGNGEVRVAVDMMRCGAIDYCVKDNAFLDFLPSVVRRSLDHLEHQQRLAETQKALQKSHEELEKLVAELQAKNEEVRTMTQQLWQATKLASVGELAASIAHELNNPLATVCLRVESVLTRTPADDPRRRPLQIVEQEAKRMGALVANLLQFSRRSDGQVSTVDVREELTKSVELIGHHLRKRLIALAWEFAPDTPTIYADRQKLRQVFLNLLTNASDAMPQSGTLTLRTGPATLQNGKPAVRIEVADTGVGIPAEHRDRIMEPFFTTKEEGKGTGLGLAICRRVVQEHHGIIQVGSEAGKGTTVCIILPVKNGANVDRLRGPDIVQ